MHAGPNGLEIAMLLLLCTGNLLLMLLMSCLVLLFWTCQVSRYPAAYSGEDRECGGLYSDPTDVLQHLLADELRGKHITKAQLVSIGQVCMEC